MSSYNDYIASKRIFVTSNVTLTNQSQPQATGSLFNANNVNNNNIVNNTIVANSGSNNYICYVNEIFYPNVLFDNAIIALQLTKGLSYLPGVNIVCQTNVIDVVDINYFYGSVKQYDAESGIMLIQYINNISPISLLVNF